MLNLLTALLEYHDSHAEAFKLTLRCLFDVKHNQNDVVLKESLQDTLAVLFKLPMDSIVNLVLRDLPDDKINKWWTYLKSSSSLTY